MHGCDSPQRMAPAVRTRWAVLSKSSISSTPMDDVVLQSRPAARGVIIALCVAAVPLLPILLGQGDGWVILLTVSVLPVAGITALVFSAILLRNGADMSSLPLLIGGSLFIVGGVACDLIATVISTPDLSQEANIVARLLLDAEFSISFVYVFGGFLQLLIVLTMCILWAAFLRHRRALVQSSFALAPDDFGSFLKAAVGGAHLTWRQWFLPLRIRDLPSAFHVLWISAPLIMAGAAYRWFLGFEWFGLISNVAEILFAAAVIVAALMYITWLNSEYRACRSQCVESSPTQPSVE